MLKVYTDKSATTNHYKPPYSRLCWKSVPDVLAVWFPAGLALKRSTIAAHYIPITNQFSPLQLRCLDVTVSRLFINHRNKETTKNEYKTCRNKISYTFLLLPHIKHISTCTYRYACMSVCVYGCKCV